jgi:hypothetical protein
MIWIVNKFGWQVFLIKGSFINQSHVETLTNESHRGRIKEKKISNNYVINKYFSCLNTELDKNSKIPPKKQ